MLGTKVGIFWEVPLLGMGFVFGRAKVFYFSSYIVPRPRVHPLSTLLMNYLLVKIE